MKDVLQIPDEIICYNRLNVDGIEALCIMLKKFAYPVRYGDMVSRFGGPAPQFSVISTRMTDMIFNLQGHHLSNFQQQWLSPVNLQIFADAIHAKGAALDNCWGFVYGTVRPVCRPDQLQRVLYNGHKRIHALKFQSIVAPNGLIANLFGHVEGKRHDSGMLADSGILQTLQLHSHSPSGNPLCIYGDMTYPLRVHLQTSFRGLHLTPAELDFNKSMSAVRIGVEWVFGDIVNYFRFLDYKKNLKIGLSAVGKMYAVCALLTNAHTCMYRSTTTSCFDVMPPSIEDYFS